MPTGKRRVPPSETWQKKECIYCSTGRVINRLLVMLSAVYERNVLMKVTVRPKPHDYSLTGI
jgi:hypothetical protein